jgi:Cu-processing system ATP-binding protein
MIDIVDLSKRFGRVTVFDHLQLIVRPGQVTALVGPNGSGKTTLIKMILGLARPDSGRVTVDGVVVNGSGAYRARIGYMPQAPCFPDNLSAAEVIDLVASLRPAGAQGGEDDALVDRFGLASSLERPVRTLSGGTRQKLSAALAFRFRPDLLVLDEPTAGLDPVAARVLKDRILAVRQAGATVLVASHVMSELEELADDVAFLLDGRARFAGPLAELMRRTGQGSLEGAIAWAMAQPVVAGLAAA